VVFSGGLIILVFNDLGGGLIIVVFNDLGSVKCRDL